MPETFGKRLARAREKKGLALEDVARATKIRVPRLRDIEADDYSNFPSLVYARGFLKNYAAFLGLDASEIIDRLDTEPGIDADGYQYLAHDAVPGERARRKPPSRLPRLALTAVLLSLALVAVAGWFFLSTSWKRLYPEARIEDAPYVGVEPEQESGMPAADASDEPVSDEETSAQARRILTAPDAPPAQVNTAQAGAMPAAEPDDDKPVMRAIPVEQSAAAAPADSLPTYEVSIQSVEKSWIKIIRDYPDAPPVFEDYLAPNDKPLVFTGSKFWITVMEQDAIIVRRNGVPVVFEGTAVVIE